VTERPALRDLGTDHAVSCHFAEELVEPQRRAELISKAAAGSSARAVSDEEEVGPIELPPPDTGGIFDPAAPVGGDPTGHP
jgi:hypothetical protein